MNYLNHRGIKLPLIGFGTWRLGDKPSLETQEIKTFQYGINNYDMTIIDTAEMYGDGKSEILVGKIIKNIDRNKLFIVDKILPSNAKNGKYIESCKKSLKLIGLDYFDLYLLHWKADVDLQDMVNQMEELVSIGLIKNWGVSNFDLFEMKELFKCNNGKNCFCNQILYNIGVRGPEYALIPWCKENDVLIMAYSPLYNNSYDRNRYVNDETLIKISKDENKSVESLMLSFVIRNKDIVTVFKTSNINHLNINMKNVFNELSNDSLKLIDDKFPVPNHETKLLKI